MFRRAGEILHQLPVVQANVETESVPDFNVARPAITIRISGPHSTHISEVLWSRLRNVADEINRTHAPNRVEVEVRS